MSPSITNSSAEDQFLRIDKIDLPAKMNIQEENKQNDETPISANTALLKKCDENKNLKSFDRSEMSPQSKIKTTVRIIKKSSTSIQSPEGDKR